jgi:hypothetical protein
MCLFIALYLWVKYGGKLIVVFHPMPHVLVMSKGVVRHGNRKTGKWKVYEMSVETFSRWIAKEKR